MPGTLSCFKRTDSVRATIAPLGKWEAERQQAAWEWRGHSVDPCVSPSLGQASALRHTSHLPAGLLSRARLGEPSWPPSRSVLCSQQKKVRTGRAFPGRHPSGKPTGWGLRSPDRLPRPRHTHTARGTASRPRTPHSSSGPKPLQPLGARVPQHSQPLLHLLPHSLYKPLSVWSGEFFY